MTGPAEPLARFALRGRVVTMDAKRRTLGDGVVYVDAGRIAAVQRASAPAPAGFEAVTPLATGGTIYPGLIELHNHLAYNALPLWRVPGVYTNRDRWQGTVGYRRYVSGPAWELGRRPEAIKATIRYVEAKSLVAGVTTSQGITLRGLHLEHAFRGIVRNCEVPDDPGLAPADPKITDVLPADAASFLTTLDGPNARLLHLAEGTDTAALAHFEALRIGQDEWAITQWLAGIHATALGPPELETLQGHGGHIVWSPFSNLALYGATTKIAEARELGITIALGSDWSPSGTKNLLAEMKVVHLALGLDARAVVEMATVNPAAILGWDAHVGSLEAGKLADLVVVAGTAGDAYANLMLARESDVVLVVIGGTARYGTRALMSPLVPADERETFAVAGAERVFQRPPVADPLVGPLPPLEAAVATIRDVLNNLPQRATEAVDQGLAPLHAVAGAAGPEDRLVLALDLEPTPSAPPDLDALAPDALGATSYASIAVPLEIDGFTTEGDAAFFAQLANLANLPAGVRAELPPLYGETARPPTPVGADALEDAEPVVRPTPLALRELVGLRGGLSAAERRRIVDQAIVVLEQVYVHLPLKRAMHAVDPVQRLRLLRQRLAEADADDGPDLDFHNQVTDVFTSLRDLHTHYLLPEPFQSHHAYLPFLVEECWRAGRPHYLVSKLAPGFRRPPFLPGVEITHWNGVPIRRAIEVNAERQGGSNPSARFARGLDALTVRPLGRTRPPDEEWVTVTYRAAGGRRELRVPWRTYVPGDASPFADVTGGRSGSLGIDTQTEAVNRTRRRLYGRSRQAPDELPTRLPGVLRARRRATSLGDVGHLRAFTFLVPDADDFVDEVVRLLEALPPDGLILDVRGNGGGDIHAAERLLQVLTPRRVEPERAQFITSPLMLALCRRNSPSRVISGLDLGAWTPSIAQAVETGSAYSLGYPITAEASANDLGQRYHGPVVLVTDARCYSATDIFAAGFQDHDVGPVLGAAANTGAGGANVWSHELLRRVLAGGAGAASLDPLPRGAGFRVALRRTTRVGARAGTPLEDLGVVPDHLHEITRRDLIEDNVDLVRRATTLLRRGTPRTLRPVVGRGEAGVEVAVTTANVDRVDAFVDGRPLASADVRRGRVTFTIAPAPPDGALLRLEGYSGGALVAARRVLLE